MTTSKYLSLLLIACLCMLSIACSKDNPVTPQKQPATITVSFAFTNFCAPTYLIVSATKTVEKKTEIKGLFADTVQANSVLEKELEIPEGYEALYIIEERPIFSTQQVSVVSLPTSFVNISCKPTQAITD